MTEPPPSAGPALDRVPTGSAPVDRLLDGGLEPDGLTELYGEGGTGKTILCLSAAIRLALAGRWVFYIDTEGVSVERVARMSGGEPERAVRRILLSSPKDLAGQRDAVRTACALVRDGRRPCGLIVLDSATLYYRLTLGTAEEEEARATLMGQLADLLSRSCSPTRCTATWRAGRSTRSAARSSGTSPRRSSGSTGSRGTGGAPCWSSTVPSASGKRRSGSPGTGSSDRPGRVG